MIDKPGRTDAWTWFIVLLIACASMWIRHGFPVFALGPVFHDDALFIKLARNICDGNWLGPYDNLTLAKGAAYPAFICLSHAAGVPLKMAEHGVYLAAALYFSWISGHLWRSRIVMVVLFGILAFNPVFWAPEVGGRVIRENLYQALSLLLIALCLHVYVKHWETVFAPRRIAILVATGICGGGFWLTREEGVWLVPSLAVLIAWGVYEGCAARGLTARERAIRISVLVGLPYAAFAIVVGAVNLANLVQYGTFRNNDFRAGDFQSAYGALARVAHDHWRPHVVFPIDARERAYSASAAARELRPYLEGHGGEMWRQTGCPRQSKMECPEIPSGWFMWALRDAVAAAGHYETAGAAESFYVRLASEMNNACESREIACGPRHASLVPPWRAEFMPMTLAASDDMFLALASLGWPRVSVEPSMGTARQVAAFQRMVHGRIATPQDVQAANVRMRVRLPLAIAVAEAWVGFTSLALPVAIALWMVLLVLAWRRKQWHRGHLVVAALLGAVVARVGLLAFLDATSIPVNQSLYPSPAVPMALALAPCVFSLAWRMLWPAPREP